MKLRFGIFREAILPRVESGISPPHDLHVLHVIDEAQNTAFSQQHASDLMSKYLRQDCRAMSIGVVALAHNISLMEKGIFNLAHGVIVYSSGQNDLLVIRDFLGDAYERAKNQKSREAMAMFKGDPPLWIHTFNSPQSFFDVPSPEFLEEQSKQFLATIELVPEPLPVEVKSPMPEQQADRPVQPSEPENAQDSLAKLTHRHRTIIVLYRMYPIYNLKRLIQEAAKLRPNDRIASAQTFRKYMTDLISIQFFEKVLLPRKKGKPSVFLWPTELGKKWYMQEYKKPLPYETPRGGPAHTISIHLIAQILRELYPDAVIIIGYTKLPKDSKIKELDLVLKMKNGKLRLVEVDYHARNLTTDRLTEMLSIPNVVSLTIVCFPKDLSREKQLEQLDTRISVRPISDFVD